MGRWGGGEEEQPHLEKGCELEREKEQSWGGGAVGRCTAVWGDFKMGRAVSWKEKKSSGEVGWWGGGATSNWDRGDFTTGRALS